MAILGAIAAPIASAFVGGLLGGGKSNKPETVVQDYVPTQVTGPFGTVNAQPGQVNIGMSPELQGLQGQLFNQAGAFFGQNPNIDPALLQAGSLASQGSAGAFGALGSFDPTQATADQFARMQELLAPVQERDRLAQESRLFSQGRLGSTGGGTQQQALLEAQNRQNLEAYMQAEQAAQRTQSHLAGLGSNLGAFGVGMQQLPLQMQSQLQGLGTGALGAGIGIGEAGMSMAELARMTQPTVGGTYTPAPSMGQQIGAGLLAGGANQLAGAFGDLTFGNRGGTFSPDYSLNQGAPTTVGVGSLYGQGGAFYDPSLLSY